MQLRWSTADCAIEQSTDDGATWTAIDGWDLNGVQGCVLAGLSIRIDAGGNLQWSTDGGSTWINVDGWAPPPPPNPSGASTDQAACNIATHIAQNIIQGSLKSAVDSFNATIEEAAAASALIALIPVFGPEIALTIDAAAGLAYLIYHTGSIGDYETASTDAALAISLQCAIYQEIKADGLVTSGNYAAVVSAIAGVGYSPTDVQTAINDYITALGLNGMLAAQQLGGLVAGDCSTCNPPTPGSTNCMTFNGTNDYADAAHWTPASATGDRTFMFWVYRQTSGETCAIMNGGASFTGNDFFVRFEGSGNQVPYAYRGNNSGDNVNETHASANATINTWTHVAVTWASGPATNGAIYVNGTNVGVGGAHPINVGLSNGALFEVGRYNYTPLPFWMQGKMRSVRLYTSLVSATDIAAIAAGGVTGAVARGAPAHWWEGDDGSGSSVHDYGSTPTALTFHGSGSHWGTT